MVESSGVTVLLSGGENIVGYADAYSPYTPALSLCDTVIIGERVKNEGEYDVSVKSDAVVVFTSENVYRRCRISGGAELYLMSEDERELKILLD